MDMVMDLTMDESSYIRRNFDLDKKNENTKPLP
jgi:hypothetical protein